jgi:4-hydroxyphenylpyruvate dioxygenase
VQLWSHGEARVLLNAEPTAHGAAVAALGVEVDDPQAAAERATRLLAPVLPRTRGPAEADLSAVPAPDGTSVFFCRTGAEDGWLDRLPR